MTERPAPTLDEATRELGNAIVEALHIHQLLEHLATWLDRHPRLVRALDAIPAWPASRIFRRKDA